MNDRLVQLVERETGKSGVTLDSRLDSLGIDSLEFVCLMQAAEEEFKCTIPDKDYASINTVGDMVRFIH